jgi:hypothetical protein
VNGNGLTWPNDRRDVLKFTLRIGIAIFNDGISRKRLTHHVELLMTRHQVHHHVCQAVVKVQVLDLHPMASYNQPPEEIRGIGVNQL